jgi:YHS domain-containing protein
MRLISTVLAATLGATLLLAAAPAARAYDDTSTAAVNVDAQGIGLHGYDPVAYFSDQAPAEGLPDWQANYDGVRYRFASQAHLKQFQANPAAYAPQFGGFCAMGVALGKKLDGDPLAWKVVDNKLYLNVNKEVQKKWLEDVPGHLRSARETWPAIAGKAPNAL